MTKILREIIGAKEPTFSTRIQQLEASTGKKTIDIELTAELLSKLNDATRKLNLDPLDTTPEELHAALLLKAREHDELLRTSYHDNIEEMIRKLNHHQHTVEIPIIKSSTLRSVLSKNPPKKVMALLGYRSVASLLKRADINQVLIGAFMHESVTWHRQLAKSLKQCIPSDITLEKPKIIEVNKKLLKGVKHPHHLPYVQFAGVVGVSSANLKKPYGWLEFAARAADGLFYVHQRGVYLKLFRFEPSMLKKIVELSYVAPISILKLATIRVPWSVVYSYISKNVNEISFNDDSAVENEDFVWSGAVELLKSVHHQLDIWKSTKIVAKPTERRPVSLNVSDIAFDALHGLSYQERTSSNLARLTLDEMLGRYFASYEGKDESLKSIGLYL